MVDVASRLPEPEVAVSRDQALAVIKEQERLGGCHGPLCVGLREKIRGLPGPSEEVYAITSAGLVTVARGGLEVADPALLRAREAPGFIGVYHTHPHSVSVPTPHDIAGATQRESLVECVGSRLWGRVAVMCIGVSRPSYWARLTSAWAELGDLVFGLTDYYTPVDVGDSLVFIPSPTPPRAEKIENEALALSLTSGAWGLILEARL